SCSAPRGRPPQGSAASIAGKPNGSTAPPRRGPVSRASKRARSSASLAGRGIEIRFVFMVCSIMFSAQPGVNRATLTPVRFYLTVRITLTTPEVDMSGPAKTLYCSFCFKSQHEVRKLIAGPAEIFICDECVELCNEFIAGRQPNVAKPSPQDLPTDR